MYASRYPKYCIHCFIEMKEKHSKYILWKLLNYIFYITCHEYVSIWNLFRIILLVFYGRQSLSIQYAAVTNEKFSTFTQIFNMNKNFDYNEKLHTQIDCVALKNTNELCIFGQIPLLFCHLLNNVIYFPSSENISLVCVILVYLVPGLCVRRQIDA